jgi:hypothetical protein
MSCHAAQHAQIVARLLFRIGRCQKVADDRHGCGAGRDHRRSALQGNPSDRNERQAPRRRAPGGGSHTLQSNRIVARLLAHRAKHRSGGDVADRFVERPLELFNRVRGQADDGIRTDHLSNRARREVLLTDVHAVGAGEARDIGAVIDDQDRVERPREFDDGFGGIEEGGARQMLCAELQESGPAGQERAGEIARRPAGALGRLDVDDRVQNRESNLALRPPRRGGRC